MYLPPGSALRAGRWTHGPQTGGDYLGLPPGPLRRVPTSGGDPPVVVRTVTLRSSHLAGPISTIQVGTTSSLACGQCGTSADESPLHSEAFQRARAHGPCVGS